MRKLLFISVTSLLMLFLAACGSEDGLTVEDAVNAFKDAGLEVEDVTEMTKDDYGLAPMKADEGVRFLIPSLGEDSGGRIFSFSSQSDLDDTKAYYDNLGKESAMLFSWTIEKENILVQINGELEEEEYEKYKAALNEL